MILTFEGDLKSKVRTIQGINSYTIDRSEYPKTIVDCPDELADTVRE